MITAARDRVQIKIQGEPLRLEEVCAVGREVRPQLSVDSRIPAQMQPAVDLVARAVDQGTTIYGLNTGFGGMAGVSISREDAASSQENLLHFLAAGTGDDLPEHFVRTAMLLRANVLSHGCSGVRFEVIQRLLQFIEADAIPCVREHGSIGASGDLVPLAVIGRAITGFGHVRVKRNGQILSGKEILDELELEKLELLPKEGLAIVNGTSFSAAIAAHCVSDGQNLLTMALAIHAMYAIALGAQADPFAEFVQRCKPHRGQSCVAKTFRHLLQDALEPVNGKPSSVQDRYSLRCIPQYLGPIVEGFFRARNVVETEMNSVSDNPLIDPDEGCFYQSGNFLGQGLSMAMDDFRRDIGLLAKHLDVQISLLVTPEFSNGLPSSLRGNNDVAYNMGLKGLQISGNSLMPLLTWYGNPIVAHFPTHAEQFNQNINGLSWESANLARKSIETLQQYISVASIFAVQALDLRARMQLGPADGRALLGPGLTTVYEAICRTIEHNPDSESPLLDNDTDRWLEQDLDLLTKSLTQAGAIVESILPIREQLSRDFETA